jgi:hypothetical protein
LRSNLQGPLRAEATAILKNAVRLTKKREGEFQATDLQKFAYNSEWRTFMGHMEYKVRKILEGERNRLIKQGSSEEMPVSNERNNLPRLAGEFRVASRLTQRGYTISLQGGTTIGYDILVFDKSGRVAFIEVKTSASHRGEWLLQKKYASPEDDRIPAKSRFVACVDLTAGARQPHVYLFPCRTVATGLNYVYGGRFSQSPSYAFPLDSRPKGTTEHPTLREHISADTFLENYGALGVEPLQP